MQHVEDFDAAHEYAAKAMELMAEHKIAANPQNFEIWFSYASGRDKELVERLDTIVEEGSGFDTQTVATIYAEHSASGKLDKAALDVGDQLGREMTNIIGALGQAMGDQGRFGNSLEQVGNALGSDMKATDIKAVIETVVAATRQMETRSRQLEQKLQASKEEVDELRSNLQHVRTEALTDQLTGIPNRKAFDETLARCVTEAADSGAPLCLLLGDIDHFKKFNDTYGHQTGDQVLRLVASAMEANLGETHLAARYGGEEFAIILPHTGLDDAVAVANEVRTTIESKELIKKSTGDKLGRVTMSLGAALFKPDEALEGLIERADACLYAAKDGGRNQVMSEADADLNLKAAAG